MKKCPNCNYETDRNDDLFCCKCGTKLKTIRLNDFCSTFGTKMEPEADCPTKCNAEAAISAPAPAPDSDAPVISVSDECDSRKKLSLTVDGFSPAMEDDLETNDDAESLVRKGLDFLEKNNCDAAIVSLRKAADQGNTEAQYLLGECCFYGNGLEENEEEAVKWWLKAAKKGHAESQFWLGNCYYMGQGVEENLKEAAKWYQAAAEQGHAQAQTLLGALYSFGSGVEQDQETAVKWWKAAAEQGIGKAIESLEELGYDVSGYTILDDEDDDEDDEGDYEGDDD